MKKQIATLTLLLLTFVAFGQYNDYDRGFKNGYKEGYCYNDFGCIAPIPPITPIPLIGESNDNYQDGYNRGFKEDWKINKQKNLTLAGIIVVRVLMSHSNNIKAPMLLLITAC